jgi:O-antigen/teichoic acid export membrane protein
VSYFKIALGWVTLALSVLTPVSILLNTELARIQVVEPKLLRARFVKITLAAVGFSTLVTLAAALLAKPVFGLLYGPQFEAAVPLVDWFIPFGALFGLGVALGPLWRAIDRVRVSIVINLIVLGLGVPLGVLALRTWGTFGAVAMVTGWYTIAHAASFLYLLHRLKIRYS